MRLQTHAPSPIRQSFSPKPPLRIQFQETNALFTTSTPPQHGSRVFPIARLRFPVLTRPSKPFGEAAFQHGRQCKDNAAHVQSQDRRYYTYVSPIFNVSSRENIFPLHHKCSQIQRISTASAAFRRLKQLPQGGCLPPCGSLSERRFVLSLRCTITLNQRVGGAVMRQWHGRIGQFFQNFPG